MGNPQFDGDHGNAAEPDGSAEQEIARHTRPFRAWGAAHERYAGPSIWERFVGWLRGIFGGKKGKSAQVEPASTSASDEWGESFGESVSRAVSQSDAGELDLDVASEPVVVDETVDSGPPPTADDGPQAEDSSPQPEASSLPPEDETWDLPAVAEPSSTPAPTLEASDFHDIWSPREEPRVEARVFEPASMPEPEPEPEKKGFFARLFSRKRQEDVAVSPAIASELTELAPADADFADDPAAASAPAVDDFADFATPPAEPSIHDFAELSSSSAAPSADDFADFPPPPASMPAASDFAHDLDDDLAAFPPLASSSLDHSAEDAANLAALLGPITPASESREEEPIPVEAEPMLEETQVIETAAVVEETVEPSATVDSVVEEAAPPEPPPLPLLEPEKKPGFFSGLLKRVSRSQFVPKLPVEPEVVASDTGVVEETAAVPAIEDEEVQIPREETGEEVEVQIPRDDAGEEVQIPRVARDDRGDARDDRGDARDDTGLARADDEDLAETIPTPMPAVPAPTFAPPAAPVVEHEFQETQPFPAFRDARDDFADDENKRATEEVPIPAFDEGEKTDEFEVVPPAVPATEPPNATAETRQVAGFIGRIFGKKGEPAAATSGEVAATAAEEDKTPFVLAKFRTFYNEVIRDKHQRADVISGFATAVMGAGTTSAESDPDFAAQLLSKRLSEMLELQAAESNWTGGDAAKYYPEAQYAMVALADETFATIDWPGRSAWHKYLLEPRMYGTRGADVEFFKRIDKLLKDAPQERGARDLARLYLLVIASGYRGKFRVPNLRRPLAEYRRRLYEYSHQADALELYARDRRIFPEAAEHTLQSRAVGRFTSAQRWVATVLILAILYLGISHYEWGRLTADLKDIMSRIQPTTTAGSNP